MKRSFQEKVLSETQHNSHAQKQATLFPVLLLSLIKVWRYVYAIYNFITHYIYIYIIYIYWLIDWLIDFKGISIHSDLFLGI